MTRGGEGAAVSGPWAPPCTGSQLFWASWDSPTWMKVTQSVRLGSYGDWLVSTLREQCLHTSKTIDSETLTAPHLDVWHPCIFWILPGLRLGRPGQALAYAPSRSHGGGCFGTVLDALASVCLVGGCLLPGCCGGPPAPAPCPWTLWGAAAAARVPRAPAGWAAARPPRSRIPARPRPLRRLLPPRRGAGLARDARTSVGRRLLPRGPQSKTRDGVAASLAQSAARLVGAGVGRWVRRAGWWVGRRRGAGAGPENRPEAAPGTQRRGEDADRAATA